VKSHDLDPANTLLWMVSSQIACNLGLFPHHLKRLFHSYGDGMNQDLVRFIERHNGEVIVTPYSSYVQMIAGAYLRKWFMEGHYLDILSSKALMSTVTRMEKTYRRVFSRILENPARGYDESPEKTLSEYNVTIEHTGESMDHLLKICYMKRHDPDVSLFVQTSPAFCRPSLVTEGMAKRIEKRTGVPVVSIT
jgi:hypothetical protein